MATKIEKPREVHTIFNYFHDTGKPLIPMIIGGPNKPIPQPKIQVPVTITEVNGIEDEFRLEQQGFQYVKHKTSLEDFDDTEAIKKILYPEMEELVRDVISKTEELPPPSEVHVLTHIIRRGPIEVDKPMPGAGPLYGVHVDQSFNAVTGVAQRWLGDRAEELLQKPRYILINTWRPIRGPVTRDPFAVSDARSIPDCDLVVIPVTFPDHKTEALEVKPPPPERPHKWYYKKSMMPDDVLFFKQIDSCEDPDVTRRVPHCAFKDPDLPHGAGEPRISIEIRAMVFFDSVRP